MGNLVFQATLGGQVNLSGPNTASTFTINVPAVNGNMVTTGDTGTVTTTMLASTTGSGAVVLATSPTLVTPLLGTPTSVTLTNATGLPLTTGVTGTLPVANGGTGVTTSTGSGSNVLSTSPTLVTPILGTPTSVTLTNATGLPLTTGVTGTLPVANGGTGLTSYTANGVLYASGTGTIATGSGLLFDGSNLGLGVTPSAWLSNRRAIEVGGGAAAVLALNGTAAVAEIFTNAYRNTSGTYIYAQNGYAGYMNYNNQAGGGWAWSLAPSGTAGATATFTQAMTLDASGNLGVGTTTPGASTKLNISGRGLFTGGAADPSDSTAAGVAINYNGTTGFVGAIQTGVAVKPLFVYGSPIQFGVSPTSEVARIDSSGNLLVGSTTATGGAARIQSTFDGAARNGIDVRTTYTSGTSYMVSFFNNANTNVGSITYNLSAVAYNTSSDYRLKHNIAPMTGALAKVALLKPCTYKWNADNSDGEGFIAHELAEICPQAVTGEKDAVDENGNPKYQGIDTSFLVATLTAAIQELSAQVTTLQNQVTALQAKGA